MCLWPPAPVYSIKATLYKKVIWVMCRISESDIHHLPSRTDVNLCMFGMTFGGKSSAEWNEAAEREGERSGRCCIVYAQIA